MRSNRQKLIACTQTAVLAAVCAVLALIALPMPGSVPLTLQTFAIALCAFLGGVRKGVPAVLIYLALGAVGIPVFSGFRSGFGVLLGPTGGFLWSFPLLALLCSLGSGKSMKVLFSICGLLLCHLCGALQYAFISGMTLPESLLLTSLPYLLKDAVCLAAAYAVSVPLKAAIRRAGLMEL